MINWKIEKRKINELQAWKKNPRTITKNAFIKLKERIKKRGFHDILKITQDNIVLSGNQRLKALQEIGIKQIDVKMPDRKLTQKEMEQIALESNISDGEWDYDKMTNEFDQSMLEDLGIDIGELDVDVEELEEEKLDKNIKDIKILNLYAGIGGNRKFWRDLDITAIEYNKEIAEIYKEYFPNDNILIEDAHKYLEEHFDEYDFIWSSPPCPTHSRLRKHFGNQKPIYPDMRLYEEILFLQGYFKGKWIIENVKSWYDPLIKPQERGRHYYWTNFEISKDDFPEVMEIGSIDKFDRNIAEKKMGFDLSKYDISSNYPKDKILRNCVHPKVGKYILEQAYREKL